MAMLFNVFPKHNRAWPWALLAYTSCYMYYMYQIDDYDDNIMTNGCLSKPDRSTSHKYALTETSYNNMTMFTTQSHITMNDNDNDVDV